MAIKSQGTLLSMETARAAADTITGITAANPPVVTATAHGLANGSIVYITGVVGMTEVNDRTFVVANQATNTFELKGIDGTGYTAYASGGSAYGLTMTAIAYVKDFNLPGTPADEIDVTHLRSVKKEKLSGLPDSGDATFGLWEDPTDTGQSALRAAQLAQAIKGFSVTGSDSKILTFPGTVKQFGFTIAANGAREASCTITLSAAEAYFA